MRPPLSTVAHPRVLVATLGFALPAPLASPAVSRCCTIALCAATPRRRSLTSKPGAVPPGALPPSLTADETNVYAGEITARVLSEREKKIVAYRQQYKCASCGCLLPPTHQIDHIVPLALGGTNGLTNLQALCVRCHVRKTRGQRHDMLSSRTAREAAEVEGAALQNAAGGAAGGSGSLAALLQLLLRESGYAAMLDKGGDDEAGRWRNLGELASLARESEVYELDAFLDQISLVSDVDALDEQGQRKSASARGAVQLSTIHGAKGLEFEHVFVTGVEEGLLPHYYCTDDGEEVEQERRLLYVAMTRAKEQLVLTHTAVRARWGKVALCEGSRFLGCLPQELKRAVARLPRRRNHRPGWRQP